MSDMKMYMSVSSEDAYFPTVPPINIELNSRCNLKCPYCANPTLAREYESMEWDLIRRVVDECAEHGYQVAAVHGVGEPLLRKDLEAILSFMRERGVWQRGIVTNGTLLTLDRMRSLHEAGVACIYTSLDTLDADLYRRTRGGKLGNVIGNVREAARAFPSVYFLVGLMNHREQVITKDVEDQFYDTFEHLPNVRLNIYENGRFPGAAEDWRRPFSWPDGTSTVAEAPTCTAPASYLTIDAKGRVSLCCADQNTEHALGDLSLQSIRDVWFDRKTQDTFRSIALGVHGCPAVCFKCVLKPTSLSIADIEPILYGPLRVLVSTAERCVSQGDLTEAKRLLEHALSRDPYNKQLQARVAEIGKLLGDTRKSYFQDFLARTTGSGDTVARPSGLLETREAELGAIQTSELWRLGRRLLDLRTRLKRTAP